MLSFTAQATIVECNPGTNNLAWYLTQGDTLVLADGIYEEAYSIDFTQPGVCVKAAESAKPVIKLTGEWTVLDVQATTTFEGITFDGGNVAKYLIATTGVNPGTLTINNCEFRNWTYWALSNQFEETASIDSVIIDNTIFHDGAEAAISFNDAAPEGQHSVQYFKLTNSTLYNIKSTEYRAIIQVNSNGEATGDQNEIVIDHITLANYDSGDLGAISMRKSHNLKISNSIIYNPTAGEKGFYIYGGNVDNTLYFNCDAKSGPTYTNCLTDDPMFVDAANGNFALAEGSPALGAATDGSNLGDPRWKVAAAELTFAMTAPAADVEATDLYTIKWNVLDPAGDATIKLEYKTEEGEWTLIEENIPTTKSAYDWNIRKMAAQTVAIRGTLTNATETIESVAAGNLTIVPEAVAPRPVRNLAGEVAENTLTLNWINPDQAYEISAAIETFEVGSYESYLSGGGTSTITVSDDKSTLTSTYEASNWAHAGIKISMEMGALETISMDLQGDASANKIVVILEQAGPYWWYTEVDGLGTEWTTKSFTINDFEPYPYNNKPVVETFDGLNITSLRVASNLNKTTSGLFSVKNIAAEGIVPAVADYAKTVVCASTTDYPAAIVASEVVYEGTASTCALTIDPTKDLYVSAFAQDDLGNTSVAAQYKYVGKNDPTGLENIQSSERACKIIRDGQIIIVRGNEVFNVLGQEIK